MKKGLKLKFTVCALVTLGSLYLLAPTIWSLQNPDHLDKMPGWMPNTAMKLGLDLQGGVHMVMGVDIDGVVNSQLISYGHSIEKKLEKEGVKGVTTSVNAQDQELEVKIPADVPNDKVANAISTDFGQVLEVVREDGKTLRTRLTNDQADFVRTHALDQSIETIRNRIDEFGVAEPVIARKGDSQVLVQFPGAQEPERLKALIGETAKLNFHIVPDCTQKDAGCIEKMHTDLQAKITEAETKGNYNRDTFKRLSEYTDRLNQDLKASIPADSFIAFQKINDPNVVGKTILLPWLLSNKNQLSGEYIENAYVTMSQGGRGGGMGPQRPEVAFQMNAVGAPLLGDMTSEFQGYYMAIVLDNIVKSAPVIQSPISDSGVITLGTGGYEQMSREASDLSIVLRAGALPAKIEPLEERVIGPSIGRDAIDAGRKALIISSIIIFLFTWAYYAWSGLMADIVIAVNIALIFGFLGAVGATLTLPGIAGIVLTIGMAVDALIIIYERMREEMRAGRNKRQVVELGFGRAFATILDSNVTTAIGAFVLLQYGTGSIRGFALTLLVGIIVNVFVATFYARVLFDVFFTESESPHLSIGMHEKELSALRGEV